MLLILNDNSPKKLFPSFVLKEKCQFHFNFKISQLPLEFVNIKLLVINNFSKGSDNDQAQNLSLFHRKLLTRREKI